MEGQDIHLFAVTGSGFGVPAAHAVNTPIGAEVRPEVLEALDFPSGAKFHYLDKMRCPNGELDPGAYWTWMNAHMQAFKANWKPEVTL